MKLIKTLLWLLLITPVWAHAQDGGIDVKANLSALFSVITLVSAVIGFFLVGSGVYHFYTWSKPGHNAKTIGGNIASILVGVFMVSIGWVYQLFKNSFIGEDTKGVNYENSGQFALALDKAAADSAQVVSSGFGKFIPSHSLEAILAFVFIVGFIAFISGVYGLKDMNDPSQNRSGSPFMQPTMRMLGGMICMNITWFGCMVSSLTGIAALCSG